MRDLILTNAVEIQKLHKRIHDTVRHRYKSPEQTERWQTACKEFHERYDRLAFPGGYSTAWARISEGDSAAIKAALCFVEIRPYFYRSGYMFKELLPKLKRADLTPPQRDRLNAVIAAYGEWRAQRRAARGTKYLTSVGADREE
jgi:hypothetical protein